jgi:hypothetical protein
MFLINTYLISFLISKSLMALAFILIGKYMEVLPILLQLMV